jgi:serine O-acetyltransferase
MNRFLHFIRYAVYAPFVLPSLCAYWCTTKSRKDKINQDIDAYWSHSRGRERGSYLSMLYDLLVVTKEFRNVYYVRLGILGRKLLPIFLKPLPLLFINPAFIDNYDGGLYVAHGFSTRIGARKIGKNLWVHQHVSIGMTATGRPEIGDNVYIGTSAVIVGGIKIGNNVRIGANATVVDDVPDNAVVVSPKAKVVKFINDTSNVSGKSKGGKYLNVSTLNAV